MRRRSKLVLFGLFFLLGVLLGTFFGIQSCVGVLLGIPFFIGKKTEKKWATAFVFAFLAGVLRVEITPRENEALAKDFEKTIKISGFLKDFPDRRRDFENWTLTTEEGKILLKLPHDADVNLGEEVAVWGKIEKPFETEEFSYAEYLARDEIFAVINFPKIEKTGERRFLPLLSPLWDLRKSFEKTLEKRIPGEESAFAEGILIGERSGFSEETEEHFRRVGLTHLLALSGFNITIVALAVLAVLFWLPQKIRIIATIVSIGLFVLFVGGGASVIRAATMGGIGLLAIHSGRRGIAFLSLIYASVIMVMISPLILAFDPSFQLSIAGTAGILAFGERIKQILVHLVPLFFAEILATTLAAQIAVSPLIGLLFGQISLVAPFANLVVAPLIPLAMLFGFLTGIGGDFLGNIFAFFAWNLLHFGMEVVDFLALWKWASVDFRVGKTLFWILSMGIAGVGLWVMHSSSQKKKRKLA